MRKIVLITISTILLILLVLITYLSIYGFKTDSFNILIKNKINEYNPKLTIKLDKVFIKLNLSQGSFNINIKDSTLLAESNEIQISNIDINTNITKFIKKEKSLKNIKVQSSENSIKSITSFMNTVNYDLSRYVLYSQIKKGSLNFELETSFDDSSQHVKSYTILGSAKDVNINLLGYGELNNINFNFNVQDNLTRISNLNLSYEEINLSSKSIEIIGKEVGVYKINGDIQNTKALINPNLIFNLAKIKQDHISNKKILLQSKNLFSFNIYKNRRIKNLEINSTINFDEIYLSNKYKNIIFLKEGVIKSKYENKKLTADIVSKFIFSDERKLKKDFKNNNLKLSLKSKNNKNIKINGTISNKKSTIDPKLILSLLKLDPNILTSENLNIQSENKFKFEVNDGKIENYIVNSSINLDKLRFNEKIQNTVYLKDLKTQLTFDDKLLKVNLKSKYSFLNNDYNNQLDNNIFNLKFKKNDLKISDIEIFFDTKNNKINTKEFKKYLDFTGDIIDDQIINLKSNFKINVSVDNKLNIKKLSILSNLNFDNLNINYKSDLIKKYLENYENKLAIRNPNILLEYNDNIINLQLDGKYSLKDKEDNFLIKLEGNKNNFDIYSLLDLDNSILNLNEIKYYKKQNIPSELKISVNNFNNNLNFKRISFTEKENNISIKNLVFSDDYKIKSVDEVDVNFFNKNQILNNFKIKRKLNNYDIKGYHIDGERLVESLISDNKKNSILKLFKNINPSITLNINKIYLEKNEYLEKFVGTMNFKNNKLFLAKINGVLDEKNKFSYSLRTTLKDERITNIFIKEPKPFINNYKFIKGFEDGELNLVSIKIENTSRSNLKITNFKIKEVPILAKILTLASLQGIADLLTGEGIRFNEFEMDFKTKNNLTEIDEMYALGPAISIMMDGYIERDKLTSLRGTLVPATTINKTISKIPLLGNILVGSKTGEGVFGISFKIKGPPNDLKSTVNPIKTLTPRFITRTLENLKGD